MADHLEPIAPGPQDDYPSEPESSSSENDVREATSRTPSGRPMKDHKSIHVKKTASDALAVEPTVIPSTYAAFRLSVS